MLLKLKNRSNHFICMVRKYINVFRLITLDIYITEFLIYKCSIKYVTRLNETIDKGKAP